MSDAPDTSTAIVPAPEGAVSSLSSENMDRGRLMEEWMGDPKSPYWRGDEHRSAAEYQEHYRSLLRGEAAGQAGPLGAPHESVDRDYPAKVKGYDLTGLPIHSAQDRDYVDSFLTHAHDSGFGVERVRDAIQFAYSEPHITEEKFYKWAAGRGWSKAHAKYAVAWFRRARQ